MALITTVNFLELKNHSNSLNNTNYYQYNYVLYSNYYNENTDYTENIFYIFGATNTISSLSTYRASIRNSSNTSSVNNTPPSPGIHFNNENKKKGVYVIGFRYNHNVFNDNKQHKIVRFHIKENDQQPSFIIKDINYSFDNIEYYIEYVVSFVENKIKIYINNTLFNEYSFFDINYIRFIFNTFVGTATYISDIYLVHDIPGEPNPVGRLGPVYIKDIEINVLSNTNDHEVFNENKDIESLLNEKIVFNENVFKGVKLSHKHKPLKIGLKTDNLDENEEVLAVHCMFRSKKNNVGITNLKIKTYLSDTNSDDEEIIEEISEIKNRPISDTNYFDNKKDSKGVLITSLPNNTPINKENLSKLRFDLTGLLEPIE